MDLIADTSYLVGLWRGQAWATSYATAHATKTLGLPWIVLGEFWHGAMVARHDAKEVQDFLSIGVQLVDPVPVVPHYARICAVLSGQKEYRNIGQNDLWIAASTLALGGTLLTGDRHFGQIDNLDMILTAS